MFRARLARVYWLSPPGRTSRRRIFGYGPEAYLAFYEPMPRAAQGHLGTRKETAADGRSGNTDQDTPDPTNAPVIVAHPPQGAPTEIGDGSDANASSGLASAMTEKEGDKAGSVKVTKVTCGCGSATRNRLFGTRVRQGGFLSGRHLLHFRESRWQM